MKHVLVEVAGGVADVTSGAEEVTVHILDWDNFGEEPAEVLRGLLPYIEEFNVEARTNLLNNEGVKELLAGRTLEDCVEIERAGGDPFEGFDPAFGTYPDAQHTL